MDDDAWIGPSLGDVLEAQELPRGVQVGRPHLGETVFARDRVGDLGVVATIRPSGRSGRAWYVSWEALLQGADGRWYEQFGNGDRWERAPDAARSPDAVHEAGTGVTGFATEDGRACVVTAGAVGGRVATLEVVTARDRHRVPFDPASGAFVLLGLPGDDGRFELIARDAAGAEIDRWQHEPPSFDAEPEPPYPGWERVHAESRRPDALGVSEPEIRRPPPGDDEPAAR